LNWGPHRRTRREAGHSSRFYITEAVEKLRCGRKEDKEIKISLPGDMRNKEGKSDKNQGGTDTVKTPSQSSKG